MAELAVLIKKRGNIKTQLTWFKRFIDNFSDENHAQLPSRIDKCKELWTDFNLVQSQIEDLDDNEIHEREYFQDRYFEVMAIAEGKLKASLTNNQTQGSETHTAVSGQHNCNRTQSSDTNLMLPKIEVPIFDGSYQSWPEFEDAFSKLVDQNSNYKDYQKFYYLKTSLRGEAAEVLQSFETTTENYKDAWDLLKIRFKNTKLIGLKHLESLFNFPGLTKQSSVQLRKLTNTIRIDLRALKNLGHTVSTWDVMLIYILEMKLDPGTRQKWQEGSPADRFSTMDEFLDFLNHRFQILERKEATRDDNRGTERVNEARVKFEKGNFKSSLARSFVTATKACSLCKAYHFLFACNKFQNLTLVAKRDEVKQGNLCWNCLKPGHTVQECTSRGCRNCGKKHHSLLHANAEQGRDNWSRYKRSQGMQTHNSNEASTCSDLGSGTQGHTQRPGSSSNNEEESHGTQSFQCSAGASWGNGQESVYCSSQVKDSEVLLSTALVYIADKVGKLHECRVLLDSGSQSNFITRDLFERLQLKPRRVNVPIMGIDQGLISITQSVKATVHSRFNRCKFDLQFLVISKISENLPSTTIDSDSLVIPDNVTLADHSYAKTDKVDLLLGATIFWDLLCIGQVKLGANLPILQKTKLGWVISGRIPVERQGQGQAFEQSLINRVFVGHSYTQGGLQDQMAKFWEIEEYQQERGLTKEELQCEEIFQKTTVRDEGGRFMVSLPLRANVTQLGESFDMARKRFYHLKRRLKKDNAMNKQYKEFMQEYINLGHMARVEIDKESSNLTYYLPHHGVFKDTSTTTKCRVVFDGSAATDTGISLNSTLMTGPKLQEGLFYILLRFRKHNVVIAADVEKMYRQVLVKEEHRDLQRILWRFSEGDPLGIYRLNTVTYGLSPSSFLAVRCLQQLGSENRERFPEACEIIQRDFYVDDLLSGSASVEDARRLRAELDMILVEGGFVLRKWISNKEEVFFGGTDSNNRIEHYISDSKTQKTLGLLWNSRADSLQYKINFDFKQCTITKRSVLSIISQIFDPLGLVGPIVVQAKLIMQTLWKVNLGWDESLPQSIHCSWLRFIEGLKELEGIQVSRLVICDNPVEVQLHYFSDASESAYGAAVFIRSTDRKRNHYVRLLCAKSRIAPLKVISIPRLELCGALLAAKLAREAIKAVNIKWDAIYFWCDSTIVLSWLAGDSAHWKTFVANRTAEIQQITEGHQRRYIESHDNPADLISRGCNPQTLRLSNIWWYGPAWLSRNQEEWPKSKFIKGEDVPDKKKIQQVLVAINVENIYNRFSTLARLQRVMSYCLRFYRHTCRKGKHKSLQLEVEELQDALILLIRLAQMECFAAEFQALKNSKAVSVSSRLCSLNPFLDNQGLIRLGGRLGNASISFEQRHPIILPRNHKLTTLIVVHEHHRHLHAGAQALLATIRLRYWLLSGRSTIRSILRKCVTCFRVKPVIHKYLMGDLPKTRVTCSRPFTNCGVDYAGPFEVKVGKIRGQRAVKAYMCVFVCFATKAVHLELVCDLSTEAFMNCFKRFAARRGICQNLYSDNGSNFIGARNLLADLYSFLKEQKTRTAFTEYFTQNMIRWHFIPPHSPHMGGLWESAVKAAKYHLRRIVGNERLYYDEFNTILTQVESCLNSRPLTPLTEDPEDLNVLTPGHFLIGSSMHSLPQTDLRDHCPNRLKRYQYLTQIVQHFWLRWSKTYLSELQQRSKWRSKSNPIKIGDMVVIRDENLPPLKWHLARVLEVHPGEDNTIRVVTVRSANGVYKRASSRLCVLPIECNNVD